MTNVRVMGQRDDLLEFAEYISQRTLTRLDGITDEELFWQPVPGAWTVHQLHDGRRVLDNSYFPVGAPALTSIAWRVSHLIDVYASPRNAEWLRVTPTDQVNEQPGWRIGKTADESVAMLKEAIDHFVGLLRLMDDDAMASKLGAVGGVFAESSIAGFVLHQLDEAVHHGAEVGILRQAAACGDLAMVRFLIEHGADATIKDAVFDATPLGWAEHFGRGDVAGYLRG